jgi:hypothetical protein
VWPRRSGDTDFLEEGEHRGDPPVELSLLRESELILLLKAGKNLVE